MGQDRQEEKKIQDKDTLRNKRRGEGGAMKVSYINAKDSTTPLVILAVSQEKVLSVFCCLQQQIFPLGEG